jgi:hypothetical protein
MIVPETSVNEDREVMFRKHYVGLTRKVAAMQPESQPISVQRASYNPLRPGVCGRDASHKRAPRLVHIPERALA